MAVTLDALQFLRQIAAGDMPYGYIPFDMRKQAADAVRKGDELLLRLQQADNSRLSLWASAYGLNSSQPVAAQGEVLAALNVPLSVRIIYYLMALQRPPGGGDPLGTGRHCLVTGQHPAAVAGPAAGR